MLIFRSPMVSSLILVLPLTLTLDSRYCCQVRRELYAQCFDELIRQTTITCVERGLLLLRWHHISSYSRLFLFKYLVIRIRDEARMTLHAYMVRDSCNSSLWKVLLKTLYESSTALGFKRSDTIDQGKYNLLETIQNLELTNRKLKQEVGFESFIYFNYLIAAIF